MIVIAIGWSLDSGNGLQQPVDYSLEELRKQAGQYPQPGIGVFHETMESTATIIVPEAIAILKGAGYRLVSVAECLGIDAYEHVGGRTDRDETWTCDNDRKVAIASVES